MISVRGRYVKGLDKARYFMSLKLYREIFSTLIGREPFEGTFNIEVENISSYRDLMNMCSRYIVIPDQYYDGRVFGGLYIWFGEIERIGRVLVVRPFRSAHKENILEIVSDKRIRDELGIDYGGYVDIKILCE